MCTKTIKRALSSSNRLGAAILVMALILGIAGYFLYGEMPVQGDALLHKRLGLQVASGDWLQSYDFGLVRTPGYPLILGTMYYLFGDSDQYIKILQIIIFAISSVFIFLLGSRIFGKFVGVMSAVWFITYYDFIIFSCLLMREIWIVFTLLLTMLFMFLYAEKRRYVYMVFAAISFAYLVLIDPRYFFYVIALMVFVLVLSKGIVAKTKNLGIMVGCVLIILAPWSVRQTSVYREFTIFTPRTDRDILALLHVPGVREVKPSIYVSDSLTREDYLTALAETGLSDSKKSALEKKLTDEYIQRMKEQIPKKRFNVWLHRFREYWRWARFNIGVRTGSDQRFEYPWGTAKNLNNIIHIGLLLPFFAVGLYSIVKQHKPLQLLLVSFILYHLVFHVFVQYLYRYRFPVLPFLFLTGWYGILISIRIILRK